MNDLIKRLGASCYLAFEDGTNDYSAAQEAIDRIEELEKQCSVYARADQFLVEDINELEAKLAKAVETLRFYAPKTFGGITFVGGDDAGKRAAASLAELRVTA